MGDSSLSRALAEAMVQARAMPQGDADERRIRRTVLRNVERAAALVFLATVPVPVPVVPATLLTEIIDGLNNEERIAVSSGRWILAIKLVRERTYMSLKDAKDVVDAYRERHPVPT